MTTSFRVSSTSTTIYSHLEHSDEIRLLSLQPRSNECDDSIDCTIKHVKLSEKPHYEALSYMWGPKENSKSIDLEGSVYNVRENLWSALHHLLLKDEKRVLWIDAICINQDDVEERNYQVTQMGRIYNNASRVVVWLGAADFKSSLAIDVLSKTGDDSDWASFSNSSILCPPATENGIQKLEAIKSFCYREYWTRLWIIQEILLATDILICCGDESLSWSALSSFFALLTKPFSSSLETTELSHEMDRIVNAIDDSIPARLFRDSSKIRHLKTWSQKLNRTLFGLCVEYGEARCEDRRDKVFGLHAFARDCCRAAAPVDYSLSWCETYTLVLLHYVLQHTERKLIGDDICVSQEFHQKLGFTSRESMGSMPSRSRLEALVRKHLHMRLGNLPIKFRGNVRGRVRNTFALGCRYLGINARTKLHPFSDACVRHLRFIQSLRPKGPSRHPQITSQIDVVWSAEPAGSQASCPTKPHFPNYLATDQDTNTQHKHRDSSSHAVNPRADLSAILSDAQKTVLGTSSADCVLAFEENGLICFGPKETQRGDLICQFLSSDVLVVVRKTWKGYVLVGRAVNLLISSPRAPFQDFGRMATRDFDVEPCWIEFEFDVHALHMVTGASVYDDDPSMLLYPVAETAKIV